MSHVDAGPLAAYNSLMDKHLAGYFSNSRMRRHLRKSGLIARSGEVVSENQYRINMARKEHKQHVKNLLAQAIVHKSLDMERMRQVAIKKKLEEIAKIELVRRVRVERKRQGDEDILPYLSPRPSSASSRPKTSPPHGRRSQRDPYHRPGAPLGFQEHPDSTCCRPIYIDADGQPVSPKDLPASQKGTGKYPKDEIDTRHLYALDNEALREYMMHLEDSQQGKGKQSPYIQSQLPDSGKIPTPPRTSRSATAQRKQRLRPIKHKRVPRQEHEKPAMRHPSRLQSLCEIRIRYHGENLHLDYEVLGDPGHDILVQQQHCGGNTLDVFKGKLVPGDEFVFLSRRHRGYPFSLSFFVNGVMSSRLSTCCEYKHTPGCKIGGKQGHFGLVSVSNGLGPCYKCKSQSENEAKSKKKENQKEDQEEEPEGQPAEEKNDIEEEDYDDDFDEEDEDHASTKKDDDDDDDDDDEGDAAAGGGASDGADATGGDEPSGGDYADEEDHQSDKEGGDHGEPDGDRDSTSGGEAEEKEQVLSSDSDVNQNTDKLVIEADVHASDNEKYDEDDTKNTEDESEKAAVVVLTPTGSTPTTPKSSEPESPREQQTASPTPRDSIPDSSAGSSLASPQDEGPQQVDTPRYDSETDPNEGFTASETDGEADGEADGETDGETDVEPEVTTTNETEDNHAGTGSESDVGAYLAYKTTAPTLEPVVEHEGSIAAMIESKPHVDLSSISLNKYQVEELCDDVVERDDIQSVVVRNGKLNDRSVAKIADSIVHTPSDVKMLNFNLNQITPDGASHVSHILKERPQIQVLLLHGNPLGDAGIKEIIDAVENLHVASLAKSPPGSDDHSLASSRSSRHEDESAESRVLQKAAKTMVHDVIADVMRSPSLQEFGKPAQKFELAQIDIGDTGMGNEGGRQVARLIALDTLLSSLNLTGNMNIKRAGWESIAAALEANTNLRVLSLDYTMLGDFGIEVICKGLSKNVGIQNLDLEGNFITDKGASKILEMLEKNSTLKVITLMPGNKISEDMQAKINSVLESRKS